MKKIILSLALAMFVGSAMAQTADAKAAAKAAKAALKAAQKEAKGQFNEALKLRDALQLKESEKKATPEDYLNDNQKIQELVTKALESGHLDQSRFQEAWKMSSDAALRLNNIYIENITNQIPMDTTKFFANAKLLTKSLQNELKYTKVTKGETGNEKYVESRKSNLAMSGDYFIYAAQLEGDRKNYDAALEAFDLARNFKNDYPEVADKISMKVDANQLAYYAFHMAHDAGMYDKMEGYYKDALAYVDGADVTQGVYLQSFMERGDTATWASKMHDVCLKDPEANKDNIQILLSHYQKQGKDKMGAFADEVLAVDDQILIANYAKAFLLFSDKKYDEALPIYQKCTELKSDYYDAWYQAGLCKYQKAMALNSTISNIKNQKEAKATLEKTKALFTEAIPFFEKARDCAPDEPRKWAYELKQCYTVAGNAEKAAEMDKLL